MAVALALGVSPVFALSVADVTDAVAKVDEAPVPIRTVAPAYPVALRQANVQGLVSVQIVVDESGTVIACDVLKSTRDEFRQPSVDAVQAWKFKPAKVAGKPVKVRITVPLKFTVDE